VRRAVASWRHRALRVALRVPGLGQILSTLLQGSLVGSGVPFRSLVGTLEDYRVIEDSIFMAVVQSL